MLVGKPERRRLLGRYRCGWDNIKVNVKETDYQDGGLHSSGSGLQPMSGSGYMNGETFYFLN
jgi:hypothetical protein